jgi:hypothetical protein
MRNAEDNKQDGQKNGNAQEVESNFFKNNHQQIPLLI